MPTKTPRNVERQPSEATAILSLLDASDTEQGNQSFHARRDSSLTATETVLLWVHRVIASFVAIAGFWEIHSGIVMYAFKTGSGVVFVHVYFYWCVCLVVLTFTLFLMSGGLRNLNLGISSH
jgi:hypothetical protein